MKKIFFTFLCFLTFNEANSLSKNIIDNKFITEKNCNKILDNQNLFLNCYDYDLKSIIFSYSKLYGDKVHLNNIKKRPKFFSDTNIPKKYRSHYSTYIKTKFDRGHSITANDASFDFSHKTLKPTYVMSNIIPQRPVTNRNSYLKIELLSRKLAYKLGHIEIFQKINFHPTPERIGKEQIAVPDSFHIALFNNEYNFKKCFYLSNNNKPYKLEQMLIDCSNIGF
jgi:endonuclease G, mitochondrial